MFDDWFGFQPLDKKILLHVHYGHDVGNAEWNGRSCVFGDGDDEVHPYTSLDTIGHEIGHGVTEFASGLISVGEPGGVDEAFSDILGEAIEEYFGETDFLADATVLKNKPFERSIKNPSLDNMSISKATKMKTGLDVHYSAGVFNRAFYVTIMLNEVSVKDAVRVYMHANLNYWHHGSSFFDCSCGVLRAAMDLEMNLTPFKHGFQDVEIKPCDVSDHILGLANNKTRPDVEVSSSINPLFRFVPTPWTETVWIEAISTDNTTIHITVQNGTWKENDNGNCDNLIAKGDSLLEFAAVDVDHTLFIQLSSDANETSLVNVTAGYTELAEP